jgi:hypothetical protein
MEKEVSASDLDALLRHLDIVISLFGATGFCLSEEADLLSQWRGYAADGTGVSIGFSQEYFEKLSNSHSTKDFGFTLQKVVYDRIQQNREILPFVETAIAEIKNGALRNPEGSLLLPASDEEKQSIKKAFRTMSLAIFTMFPHFYTLKNPAFREEQEWRLISYVVAKPNDMNGGEFAKMDFCARGNRIIPYRKIDLTNENVRPILSVTLGPKNITPDAIVQAALVKAGFADVRVTRSEASLR